MTDAHENTPAGEHGRIDFKPDYDDYGLHQQEDATTIIRIDHDTSLFERIGKIESVSSGIVVKEHTRLTDNESDDITEAFTPIQFVSIRSDEFEPRLRDVIFDLIYDEKVPQEVAKELSVKLAEAISNQYNNGSPYH